MKPRVTENDWRRILSLAQQVGVTDGSGTYDTLVHRVWKRIEGMEAALQAAKQSMKICEDCLGE